MVNTYCVFFHFVLKCTNDSSLSVIIIILLIFVICFVNGTTCRSTGAVLDWMCAFFLYNHLLFIQQSLWLYFSGYIFLVTFVAKCFME